MKKVVFMGTPDFSVPILERLLTMDSIEVVLVVTQPDRPVGRKQKLTPPPVKKEALKHGLQILQPAKIKNEYEEIFTYEPDLIVTAAYGQILPKELLQYPEYGCINVHASLLPELRGGAPIHYAILEGKKETGITIMYMVEKLDAGDILSQERLPIAFDDDVGTLHDKLSKLGANLLEKTIPKLLNRSIQPIPQDEKKATYAPNITRKDEKINWSSANIDVYNQIRGLRPWPVAYTTLEGLRMKIWSSMLDDHTYEGTPGEIVKVSENSFTVLCGNGKGVTITEIQPAGRRKMAVEDYLRGSQNEQLLGKILGE